MKNCRSLRFWRSPKPPHVDEMGKNDCMQLTITHPTQEASAPWLRRAMLGLCLALIVLQAGDAISTHMALATGHAEEKNELLLSIASMLNWSVMDTVFAAKVVTGGLFGVAMIKAKPNKTNVICLALLVAYFVHIVSMNFYWALTLG